VVSEPLFQFTEPRGPFAVGLEVIEQYDHSRIYGYATDELGRPHTKERSRPLQTLVWYPAAAVARDSAPMTVGDYGKLLAIQTTFDKPRKSAYATEWLEAMASTLSMPLWAVRDAPAAAGRYPVVIYAPSFSSMSWENADLCEYLASHGYVVIASPSTGATTRDMTHSLAGIDAQARDVSFLIGFARSVAGADLSRVAVAGFSWGGISSLFAAARDDRISALVVLDGSLRAYRGLVRQAGDVHPEHMRIPLLSFSQRYWSYEELDHYLTPAEQDGPNVLNAWVHGDFINVDLLRMTHAEFSSMYQRNEAMWWQLFHLWPHTKADYGRLDGTMGYACVARYTLRFLDAYLKHERSAAAFLKATPAENGIPPHVMSVSYRSSKGTPASFESFRGEVGARGFGCLEDIYAEMRARNRDFWIPESAVTEWSEELLDSGHFAEALCLLQLSVRQAPEAWALRLALGNAHRRSGQEGLAREHYRRVLELDPSNAEARKRLHEP